MTLIIAAEGKDFIVLAADSKGTWEDDSGSRMESISEEKLIQLTKYVCVLIADEAEYGVQLVEEFKARNKNMNSWGISKIANEFSLFCRKELSPISNSVDPTSSAFPSITFMLAGLDKEGSTFAPKINTLRSNRLFIIGRHKGKAAEGVPFIARYILSKKYNSDLSPEKMGFVVAEAMRETISVDGNVGGKVRMAIINENGVRVLAEGAVQRYMDGPEEDEKHRLDEENEKLEKLAKE